MTNKLLSAWMAVLPPLSAIVWAEQNHKITPNREHLLIHVSSPRMKLGKIIYVSYIVTLLSETRLIY